MDVIRDSAFFTTLLHCALAYSIYPYNLAQKSAYDVSSIPGSGILQTPSYDRAPEAFVTPSWQNRPFENTNLLDVQKNPSYIVKPLGSTLKIEGIQYPLTMPGAKLSIDLKNGEKPVVNQNVYYGQSGASVKIVQNTPTYLTELSGEVNKKLLSLGYPRMNLGIYPVFSGLEPKPTALYPTDTDLYLNVPGKAAHTQSYQMPNLVLKPAGLDYPSTAPGYYGKDIIPYTPSYKTDQIGAVQKPDYQVYAVTKPITPAGKNMGVADLPPVPTPPLPPLQRIRITLMNTVAGLPGASTELLNSIRAQ